jgi:FKBP-type peptidyl-prolyl cis-trans isomerase
MEGIRTKDLKIGTGAIAENGLNVVVRYDCYLPRGDRCDVGQLFVKVGGDRSTFPAITNGIEGMAIGGVRRIKVSPQLAYYEREKHPKFPGPPN